VEFVSVALAQENLLLGVSKENGCKCGILFMSCWQYVSEARAIRPSCFVKNDGRIKVLHEFYVVLIMVIHCDVKIRHSKNT
jgi:hypothetical protein